MLRRTIGEREPLGAHHPKALARLGSEFGDIDDLLRDVH